MMISARRYFNVVFFYIALYERARNRQQSLTNYNAAHSSIHLFLTIRGIGYDFTNNGIIQKVFRNECKRHFILSSEATCFERSLYFKKETQFINMGAVRPKSVDTDGLHDLFEINSGSIISENKVLPATNGIWKFIQNHHNVKKTTKAIYTAALKWWKQFQNLDVSNHNSSIEPKGNEISIETSTGISSDEHSFSSNSPKKGIAKEIRIKISPKVWKTIQPNERIYKRKNERSHTTGVRKYTVMKPGLWTDVISNEIAKHPDIPCSWIFKRNKCYLSGRKYVELEGKCSVCSAVLVGAIDKKPDENQIVDLLLKMYGINSQLHTKKKKNVRITEGYSRNISSQRKTATMIRRNMLKESSGMFKPTAARIPTANAIRCKQYRIRQSQKISTCPFTALTYLQHSNLYMNCISRLGWQPFNVFYSSPEQMKLLAVYKKRNPKWKVSCDATGGIVHKLGRFRFSNP